MHPPSVLYFIIQARLQYVLAFMRVLSTGKTQKCHWNFSPFLYQNYHLTDFTVLWKHCKHNTSFSHEHKNNLENNQV